MAEEHDFQLQIAISAINDVVLRIDNLHDPSEISSIILQLQFINRMPRLHDTTWIETRYNSRASARNSYQASLDRTGQRGRSAFIITAEQLSFPLE